MARISWKCYVAREGSPWTGLKDIDSISFSILVGQVVDVKDQNAVAWPFYFPTSLCGVLVSRSSASASSTQHCHTPSFNPNFVTHHLLTHTHATLSHTLFHTQLCHTPSLSHITLSHIIFQTQLCHTLSFTQLCHTPLWHAHTTLSHTIFVTTFVTHHFVTHTTLSHIVFHAKLCHTHTHHLSHHLCHTSLCRTQLCHRLCFTHNFVTHHLPHTRSHTTLSHTGTCVAGVALGDIHVSFAWQAWHLLMVTSTFHVRGRRGTWRHLPAFGVAGVALVALGWPWWRAWSPLVARGVAALCVAGAALGDIDVSFAWQAWHLLMVTSTFHVRGRRGTSC